MFCKTCIFLDNQYDFDTMNARQRANPQVFFLLAAALPAVAALCAPLALGACAERKSELPFAAASATIAPDPADFGPFPVGVKTMTLLDPSRVKEDGTPRKLVTEVWYPAVEGARGQAGVSYDVLTLATASQRASLGEVSPPLLRTRGVRDADARTDHGPFPLVVFSHGQGGIRWQSTFFTVLLASHGYVVVSPDHEGNTLANALADNLSNVVEGFADRPADVSFLIEQFAPSAAGGDSLLPGLVDPARVGVAGHSFGAMTALRVAARDPRIKAIALHAPPDVTLAWIELPATFALDIPVMVLGGGRDRTLEYVANTKGTFDRLQSPRWLVNILDGGHFTFSDLCAFNLSALAGRVGLGDVAGAVADGCIPPAPSASLAQPLINFYSVGFFNAALRGSKPSYTLLTQRRADQRWGGVAEITADPGNLK